MASESDRATFSFEEIPTQPGAPTEKVLRIRNYLLILVTFQWSVCLVDFAIAIHSRKTDESSAWLEPLISVMMMTVYYSFGLLVIYRYQRIGILIFAWIGVILFVVTCVLVGYIILIMIALGADFHQINAAMRLLLVIALLAITVATLQGATFILAFTLAKSILVDGYMRV